MKKDEQVINQKLKKIDKITRIITIVICVLLGTIFISACVYMLNMINNTQNTTLNESSNNIQNMNLVSM